MWRCATTAARQRSARPSRDRRSRWSLVFSRWPARSTLQLIQTRELSLLCVIHSRNCHPDPERSRRERTCCLVHRQRSRSFAPPPHPAKTGRDGGPRSLKMTGLTYQKLVGHDTSLLSPWSLGNRGFGLLLAVAFRAQPGNREQ